MSPEPIAAPESEEAEERMVETIFRLGHLLTKEAERPPLSDGPEAEDGAARAAYADQLIATVGTLLSRLGDLVPRYELSAEERHALQGCAGPEAYEHAERVAELLERLPPGTLNVPITAAQIRLQIRRAQRMERLQLGLTRLMDALDRLRRRTGLEVAMLRHLEGEDEPDA